MAIELVDVGTTANDGTGDPNRDAWIKYNNSVTDLDGRAGTAGASNNYATGRTSGGVGTVNVDNVSVDITVGTGYVVDSYTDPDTPVVTSVSWTASNVAITSIGSITKAWIFSNSSGALSDQSSTPTTTERRENIYLCEVQIENSIIISIRQIYNTINNHENTFLDYYQAMGGSFIVSGGEVTGKSAVLSVTFATAKLFSIGANSTLSDPNNLTIAAADPLTFSIILRDQTVIASGRDVTVFVANKYDNAGTSTTVTAANATVQYLWFHGESDFALQLGQTEYANITTAYDSIETDFESLVIPGDGWELIAAFAVLESATDATNTAHVRIKNGLNPLGHGTTTDGAGGSSDHNTLSNRNLANQHNIGSITSLQSSLDGKSAIGHTHVEADITDLDTYTTGYLDTQLLSKLDHTGGILTNPGLVKNDITTGTAINLVNGNWVVSSPSGAITYTITATKAVCSFTMRIVNGGTNITFPASVKFEGGVTPTWTVSGIDIIRLETDDTGTTWYVTLVILDIK